MKKISILIFIMMLSQVLISGNNAEDKENKGVKKVIETPKTPQQHEN
jgi:hypothetical protein